MEDVLSVYHRPYNPKIPLLCIDEASKQLVKEMRNPLGFGPGKTMCYDYEYERNGVCNLFMISAPLEGWRHVEITNRRTAIDWANRMKDLVDIHFPDAEKIILICDNLNTHNGASLYQAFPPAEARRILDKIEWHYTPVHGSWLNIAEIEISVLQRQCLKRRIPDQPSLEKEIQAWQNKRNQRKDRVNWRFSADDARIKLKKLYPSIQA